MAQTNEKMLTILITKLKTFLQKKIGRKKLLSTNVGYVPHSALVQTY